MYLEPQISVCELSQITLLSVTFVENVLTRSTDTVTTHLIKVIVGTRYLNLTEHLSRANRAYGPNKRIGVFIHISVWVNLGGLPPVCQALLPLQMVPYHTPDRHTQERPV